jgi:hypothetical protein
LEKKRRSVFSDNSYPPKVGRKSLPDKTIVDFWYKSPDLLLKHQINELISATDVDGIERVDIATGGNHGGGRFWMALKLLIQFAGKPTISIMFEIANALHSSNDIEVMKDTVLDKIIMGYRNIHEGGRFVVMFDEKEKLQLSFFSLLEPEEAPLCDVPLNIFVNGDLKFFAQILG